MERLLVPLWPDACEAIGVGRTTGFALAANGEIETVTIGRRRLVHVESIVAFAERLRQGATHAPGPDGEQLARAAQ